MRRICVVTGTRAEYGLLFWLMKEIQSDPELQLQLIVTGTHLSPEYGLTYKIIEQDGFNIDWKVEMLLSSDTPVGITKSMGLGVIGYAEMIDRLSPNIMVILGDRYEIFAAAQAAMIGKIPIAHIHGGEITEGAIDDAMRHAITKMSHLHFVAAEQYKKRIIQLGENPQLIFNVGALGLDNINKLQLLNKEEFQKAINFSLGKINFLFTYHPVTLSQESTQNQLEKILKALDFFSDANIIFTKANADAEGRTINKILESYCSLHASRAKLYTSLGQLKYLSAIKHVDVVIGNSSSGLLEVPFLKKPTVNIGERQGGRLKAASVIDCKEDTEDIIRGIKTALSPKFAEIVHKTISPYGVGNASVSIKDTLKHVALDQLLIKKFRDLV